MIQAIFGPINLKRATLATLVMFVYVWLTDFIIHGVLLKGLYLESQNLWRPEAEMHSYFPWMLLGQFLIAKFFTLIFIKGYQGKGVAEGLRFGFLMGIFAIAPNFIMYAVVPYTPALICSWVVYGFLQVLLGGVVVSKVYRH